jgi:signal transduction histidine kinase
MLKENELIGEISIYRQEVRPFTDKQVELVQNFAAQAVIAIENARLLNELRESLEQQTASADVLRVISSSPGELEPVFQAMLENATRICDSKFAQLFAYADGMFRMLSGQNIPPEMAEFQRQPRVWGSDTAFGRLARDKQTVHVLDTLADSISANSDVGRQMSIKSGVRTLLAVPMIKDNELVGAFCIYRSEVQSFTDKQIALVTNFAAQAVIAIENTRLLNELRQRTTDLTESLEQQTATSEVLRVISSSPSDLAPVFQAMLANATRLCEANFGTLNLYDNGAFPIAAMHNVPNAYAEYRRNHPILDVDPRHPLVRVAATKQVLQIVDMRAEALYIEKHSSFIAMVDLAGARTLFIVPMLKENDVLGAITIFRQEVRPFTDKQIALVQNFAAQAVIAIENARLLNELRQRTADLSESLDRQTATSEVLQVISSSTFDLDKVFGTLLNTATRLCESTVAGFWLADGDNFKLAAARAPSDFVKFATEYPVKRDRGTVTGRTAIEGRTLHIPDVLADQEYTASDYQSRGQYRSALGVPLLRQGETIGVFTLTRSEAKPFNTAQIELVQNFAAQAVVAIENTRLLNELRQSLQQQTATADVLKVISRSTFDLQTVLNTLAESAVRLCEADIASIHRQRGSDYQALAIYGGPSEQRELVLRTVPFTAGRGSVLGRTVAERQPIQIPDVLADPDYSLLDVQRMVGFRTIMGVPILREGNPIGVIVLMRLTVRPFSEKQIELATTFADQAGIAIENVRLFDEIQDKSRQLEEASQHKSQFLANMSHELRTPLNAILGYTELMTDGAYGEPSEKMLGILKRLEANGKHLLGLINDVLDLSKIEAGQLELELSDYCIQDIAQTVRSTLEPLAADKKLAFKVEVASKLPPGRGDGRRLTQVLINLVGNAIKFTDAGEVAIKAEANNGAFHVSVRDTGPGISAADQAKLFQEFQQADNAITRKKGGTGLGLAISKRIIEMHGGRIWVESQPGQGSTFTFTLPVIVERQVEPA